MTYNELNMMSAGWGFELGGCIAMDIVNNQRCFLKGKARERAMQEKVSDYEIKQIVFWAKKLGMDWVERRIRDASEVAA
jgi:hypothetical protein